MNEYTYIPDWLTGWLLNCCWSSPAQPIFVPSPTELMPTFYCVTALGAYSSVDHLLVFTFVAPHNDGPVHYAVAKQPNINRHSSLFCITGTRQQRNGDQWPKRFWFCTACTRGVPSAEQYCWDARSFEQYEWKSKPSEMRSNSDPVINSCLLW
jgi:hypothetical protein